MGEQQCKDHQHDGDDQPAAEPSLDDHQVDLVVIFPLAIGIFLPLGYKASDTSEPLKRSPALSIALNALYPVPVGR